jgi:uncharacterized membrane protein YiaA
MSNDQRKLSATSILFALLFYTIGVWSHENEAPNAGDFFIIMAIMFGVTAVIYVLTSRPIALVVSTIIMLGVGVYFITPIASEAIQEMVNLLVAALLEAVETSGWAVPMPVLP